MKDLAQLLAQVLKRTPSPRDEAVPQDARAAAIALIAESMRAHARRKRLRVGLLAAAAVVAGFFGSLALTHRPYDGLEVETARLALVMRGDSSEAAQRGGRLGVGARVETTSGGAVGLRFQTGSQLWLEQKSALELLSTGSDQSMRLSAGRVTAQVAPLGAGRRFRIVTADVELEVRGTRFSVEWLGTAACADQAATRVRVEEGTVCVRHGKEEALVHAGEHWPKDCVAAGVVPVAALAVALPAPRAVPAAAPIVSRLAEENRRFGEVLQARQAGQMARALELLDGLRRDFPRGQLQEDVAAEEMRLTAGRDATRSRAAALSYLRRFPHGYARALAEELVGPTK